MRFEGYFASNGLRHMWYENQFHILYLLIRRHLNTFVIFQGPEPVKTAEMSESGVDSQWHVTALAAAAFCLCTASQRSSGFLYLSLIEDYGLSRAEASWPDSLIAFSSAMAGR